MPAGRGEVQCAGFCLASFFLFSLRWTVAYVEWQTTEDTVLAVVVVLRSHYVFLWTVAYQCYLLQQYRLRVINLALFFASQLPVKLRIWFNWCFFFKMLIWFCFRITFMVFLVSSEFVNIQVCRLLLVANVGNVIVFLRNKKNWQQLLPAKMIEQHRNCKISQ